MVNSARLLLKSTPDPVESLYTATSKAEDSPKQAILLTPLREIEEVLFEFWREGYPSGPVELRVPVTCALNYSPPAHFAISYEI